MKIWQTIPIATALLILQAQSPPLFGQPAASATSVPLYRVTVVQGSAKAINYRDMKFSTKIDLKGTVLLPAASGVASVKGKKDGIHITAKFKDIPPASTFGGEFLTYVMWGISTEGRATNLGELVLKNGQGKVEATEQLQTFGLVVTAEPYFAVSQPSDVVVMENAARKDTMSRVEIIDAKYELLKRGQYTLNLASTEPMIMDEKTPFDVYQARNAVRIAQAAGASSFAPDAYTKSEGFLSQAENPENTLKARVASAREATQRAEDARLISVQGQAAQQKALEEKMAQNQLDDANREAALATAAESDALRQNKLTETQNAELQTQNVGLQSKNAGLQTKNEGLQSRNEGLRAELKDQLNAILQTRDTARGLIVNMSGVLFQNGKAVLLPAAREKLAKIAGILSTHKGLKIQAEGYTDSKGTEVSNQRLSEQRASNTKAYLVSQGVSKDSINYEGFGEDYPIASNDTDAGRQENRRVELIVSGEGITDSTDAEY